MKLTRKIVAAAIALAMVVLIVPVFTLQAAAAEDISYILDAQEDLTPFAEGDKADGDTDVVGDEDYFTIHHSAKTKVDSSEKKFEDGYSSSQRLNFNGKAQVGSTIKNCVEFTTSNPATVKIWWVQAGDDNRQIGLLDTEGEVVTQTEGTYEKNQPYFSTLELSEAGTYYLGGVTNKNYIFKIEVIEHAAAEDTPVEPPVETPDEPPVDTPDEPPVETPDDPSVPSTGDEIGLVFALLTISAAAVAVLLHKKRAF